MPSTLERVLSCPTGRATSPLATPPTRTGPCPHGPPLRSGRSCLLLMQKLLWPLEPGHTSCKDRVQIPLSLDSNWHFPVLREFPQPAVPSPGFPSAPPHSQAGGVGKAAHSWAQRLPPQLRGSRGPARDGPPFLPGTPDLCLSRVHSAAIKDLRARMHQAVDRYCDEMENEESGCGQDDCKESYLDTMEAHYQEHHPELTPLLEKERDGLRCRGNRSPVPDVEDPATEEPGESFCDKVMRRFQAMLQRLQTWWHGVLAWVKEKVAALVHAVQALWREFQRFCCSLSKLFRSSFPSFQS
ncbi:interleukin-32 isoform X2 [Pongo abelii]|uniref:interleukin-32 isoform X2 n=1 Tax=Pongo abelii TaxID=9601 RepID=UPI0023E88DC8|nr:interleukin-32 isoform X2 [Pongo abelii]